MKTPHALTRTVQTSAVIGGLLLSATLGIAVDWQGRGTLETRWFPRSSSLPERRALEYAARLDAGAYYMPHDRVRLAADMWVEWHSSYASFRVDARELHVGYQEETWRLRVGLDQVNWGASDIFPVVDVVNQRDRFDWPHRSGKLGQPILSLALWPSTGQFDLHIMPFFRPFPFPEADSRLQPLMPIADELAIFETGRQYHSMDVAMRYRVSFAQGDLSIHYFEGRHRFPLLVPETELPDAVRPDPPSATPRLIPVYEDILQIGADLQWAIGAWLWKAEAAHREGMLDDYVLGVVGFERTFSPWQGSGAGLTWIIEYAFDQRGKQPGANTLLDNDIFLGFRWTAAHAAGTEIKGGVLVDLDHQEQIRVLEWSRRVGSQNRVNVEAAHLAPQASSPLYAVKHDSFVRMQWVRFF